MPPRGPRPLASPLLLPAAATAVATVAPWRAVARRLGLPGLAAGSPLPGRRTPSSRHVPSPAPGISFSGCSASYIFAMDRKTYELVGLHYPGNRAEDVFISVSVILGDGLYNLIKIVYATIKEIMNARAKQGRLPAARIQDGSGYVGFAAISTATVPMIFPQIKWYLVLSAYLVAPLLAFCNTYGTGLTDRKECEDFAGAVESGLILGDGIWTVPSAILSILRIDPPICMYFKPSLSS